METKNHINATISEEVYWIQCGIQLISADDFTRCEIPHLVHEFSS